MTKLLLLLNILSLTSLSIFCQGNNKELVFNSERTVSHIYDYFREVSDSSVWYIDQMLMDYSYLDKKGNNEYVIHVTDSLRGELSIFFKDHLLYRYHIKNGKIEGLGYIYYPFDSSVAVQGVFKNGKLSGLVIVQDRKGEVLRIMKYKKGKYKRHIFSFITNNKKGLKKMSKNRSDNPLRGDEVIVM